MTLRLEISGEIHDEATKAVGLHKDIRKRRSWHAQRLAMAMTQSLGDDKERKRFLMAVLGTQSTRDLDEDTFVGLWCWCKPYTVEQESKLGRKFDQWRMNDNRASLAKAVIHEAVEDFGLARDPEETNAVARVEQVQRMVKLQADSAITEPSPYAPKDVRYILYDDLAAIGAIAVEYHLASEAFNKTYDPNIDNPAATQYAVDCATAQAKLKERIEAALNPIASLTQAQAARNRSALRGEDQGLI